MLLKLQRFNNRKSFIIASVVFVMVLVLIALIVFIINRNSQSNKINTVEQVSSYPVSYIDNSFATSYPILQNSSKHVGLEPYSIYPYNDITDTVSYTVDTNSYPVSPKYDVMGYDYKYKFSLFQNWDAHSGDGTILNVFHDDSKLLTISSEQSDLNPKDYYTNIYTENSGENVELVINNFPAYKTSYTNDNGSYTDYAIKVNSTIVLFHFINSEGTLDNSNFIQYYEETVNTIQGL